MQEFNAPVITTDPSPGRAVNLGKERERGDDAICAIALPCKCNVQCNAMVHDTNIAKGTTDPRVEFISQIITQILIKHLQNLDQAPTSKSQPNISISTKLNLKNLDLFGQKVKFLFTLITRFQGLVKILKLKFCHYYATEAWLWL